MPHRFELPSGTTAVVLPMTGTERAVLHVFLRTGSRYETPSESGISHFLEHMLFRGTEAHPSAHALASAFEDLGGTLLASTAADHGTLSIAVPNENFAAALTELGRVIRAPRLREIELERGIIREEVLEDFDDQGQLLDGASLVRSLAFPRHGLGQLITGPLENIERFDERSLAAHHRATYVGRRMVVVVTGRVSPDEVSRQLEAEFSGLPEGAAPTAATPPAPTEPLFELVRHPGGSQTSLHLAFRGLPDGHPLEPALDLLLRVVDDGMSTRLYHRLCDSRGLCYDAYASYEAYSDAGLVEFGTETAHERAAIVTEELLGLTRELTETAPNPTEIERAKKRARWQTRAMFESPYEVGEFLAMGELTNTAKTPLERLRQLEAVSERELLEVARLVFSPRGRVLTAVGNPKRDVVGKLEKLAASS